MAVGEAHQQIVIGVGVSGPLGQKLVQLTFQHADIPAGQQRMVGYLGDAFAAHLNKGDAFALGGFGKAVLQQRAAIANMLATANLRAVKVTQCHVVKALHGFPRHAFRPAQGERALGVAGGSAIHKTVAHQ